MSIAKVIEVIGESEESWDAAAREVVAQASKSVKNIKHLYVENLTAEVKDGEITMYRLNGKITFLVQD